MAPPCGIIAHLMIDPLPGSTVGCRAIRGTPPRVMERRARRQASWLGSQGPPIPGTRVLRTPRSVDQAWMCAIIAAAWAYRRNVSLLHGDCLARVVPGPSSAPLLCRGTVPASNGALRIQAARSPSGAPTPPQGTARAACSALTGGGQYE